MTKRLINIAMGLCLLAFVAVGCTNDEAFLAPEVPEGYVALTFEADIPDMTVVNTRSVDPDGGGVQNMTLFCFNSYGVFISTVKAELVGQTGGLTGTFNATVPQGTRTIHFVANQIMDDFAEDDFRNKSEADVMGVLEGSSGRMIYWDRFACSEDNDANIAEQMQAAGKSVKLIRNHAQISVANPTSNGAFVVTGFQVYNANAFGTVAPRHPSLGYDFTWPSGDNFVTLPANRTKMSDINEVTTDMAQYIFESENNLDDPVSVILTGYPEGGDASNQLYYRVMLIDGEGEQLLLRRNHHYRINISGALSYGQPTFEAATTSAATNNVWVSVSDEVNEVQDANFILAVEQTSYVLGEEYTGQSFTINYTLTGVDGRQVTTADRPDVSWIENEVAGATFQHNFVVEGGVGRGSITIRLNSMPATVSKLEGALRIKKGLLQRRVKVITIKKMKFEPAWVGTQIYGGDATNSTRSNVTAMFRIPDDCPAEAFPIKVFISCNELDVRSESGMQLDVVTDEEDDEFGDTDGYGYKYVYVAEAPGVHRIYFENILAQKAGTTGKLKLESTFFESLEKTFTYSSNQQAITVQGLSQYNAQQAGSQFADDEVVLYLLVPQKKGANVTFDMVMKDAANDREFNVGADDEFLLYSQNLNHYEDDEAGKVGLTSFPCYFKEFDSSNWGTGGRVMMFKPHTAGNSKYSIYLYTNRAKSDEVIRIASNQSGSTSGVNPGQNYTGHSYRSVTFELANYNPFRFAAQLNGEGNTGVTGSTAEDVDEVSMAYGPERTVDLRFDVTSFLGSDNKSVDPFGHEFEIYIDAPMLEIDESRLAACHLDGNKLKKDPNVEGRFIYTVNADRTAEQAFGTGTPLRGDAMTNSGERKTLPFRTVSAVSAGDVVLSSDEDEVVFFAKTFRLTNAAISGTLKYQPAGGQAVNVPQNAFVSFELVRNGSRIGSVTVSSDGRYELRLRKEYHFNWNSDKVEFHYTAADGIVYHAAFDSPALLQQNGAEIVLTPATP